MFGLIYGLATLLGFTGSSIGIAKRNFDNEQDAITRFHQGNNPDGTFYNYKYQEIDLRTHKKVLRRKINGDTWLVSYKGERVRNLSEERRNRALIEAKSNSDRSHTTVRLKGEHNSIMEDVWDETIYKHVYTLVPVGMRYQDLVTNRLYVERDFTRYKDSTLLPKNVKEYLVCGVSYYMDMETGLLERIADSTLQLEEKHEDKKQRLGISYTPIDKEKCEKFIEEFNKYQKEMKPKYRWIKTQIGKRISYSDQDEFSLYYWNLCKTL